MYFHLSSTLTYDFMSMMVTLKKLLLGYLRNKIDLNVAVNMYFYLSSLWFYVYDGNSEKVIVRMF